MEAKCVSFAYESLDGVFGTKSESGMVAVVKFDEEMKGKRRGSKERNRAKEKEAICVFFFLGKCAFGPKLNSTSGLVLQ